MAKKAKGVTYPETVYVEIDPNPEYNDVIGTFRSLDELQHSGYQEGQKFGVYQLVAVKTARSNFELTEE